MMVNSFLGLMGKGRRHDPQPGVRSSQTFRTDSAFHFYQVKEYLLADFVSVPLAANRKRLGRAPVEHPVIRREREDV